MEKQPHHQLHDLEALDLPDRTISQWRIVHETQPRLEKPHDDIALAQPPQTINTTATVADSTPDSPMTIPSELTDDLVFGAGNLEEIFTDLFCDESVDYILQHSNEPAGEENLAAAVVTLSPLAPLVPVPIHTEPALGLNDVIQSAEPELNATIPPRPLSESSTHRRDGAMVNYEQLASQLQQQLQQQQIQHQEQMQSLQTSFQELLTQRDELEAQLKRHIATHHALQQSLRLLEKDHSSAEKQVQDLTQEVQTLRHKFQQQFGHVQDYESHISHWKEQAVRHQHHAMQLSAALDRLLSSKDSKQNATPLPPQIVTPDARALQAAMAQAPAEVSATKPTAMPNTTPNTMPSTVKVQNQNLPTNHPELASDAPATNAPNGGQTADHVLPKSLPKSPSISPIM